MKFPRVPKRTTPSFAFSMVERALSECLADRQFSQKEVGKVLTFFGTDPPECVFCGSPEVKRWDHLVAISKGGETVLGNMVPACARCDDSKRDVTFEEWVMSDAAGSPKSLGIKDIDQRVERIKAYIQYFGYIPRSLEERLDEHELERLITIRSRVQELKKDVEALIEGYRAKTTQALDKTNPST